MMNELTFLDLAVLKKVNNDSSVERFGSQINTSFFETANLLGSLKIKGYINIESSIGGISKVALTDAGVGLLSYADQKEKEPIEPLDNAILQALSRGDKNVGSIQNTLNIRSADLAYHLNKLIGQGFVDYEIRSGIATVMLTERGFNMTGSVRADKTQASEESKELTGEDLKKGKTPKVSVSKDDVSHILSEAHEEVPEEKAANAGKKALQGKPKAVKVDVKAVRLYSKIQHYLLEYAPFILLAVMVVAVFLVAIFLSLEKSIF